MSNNFTQDLFTSRRNYDDGNTRIGQSDRLWYDSITNTFRIGNGEPGGKIVGSVETTFEYFNKNIKSYPSSFNYSNNNLSSIVYVTPNGNIIKSFTYNNSLLTTITLSGDGLGGFTFTKNFSYVNNNLSSISYSS